MCVEQVCNRKSAWKKDRYPAYAAFVQLYCMAWKTSQKFSLAAALVVFGVIVIPSSYRSFRIVCIEFWLTLAVIALYLYFVKGKQP